MKEIDDEMTMRKTKTVIVLSGICILIIASTVTYALNLARKQSDAREIARASLMANEIVTNAEAISTALANASLMEEGQSSIPCSRQMRGEMLGSVLQSPLVAGMAVVKNDTIQCLSFTEEQVSIPVGPAQTLENWSYELRENIELPYSKLTKFSMYTERHSGLSVLLHKGKSAVIAIPSESGISAGLASATNHQIIIANSPTLISPNILKRLWNESSGNAIGEDGAIISWTNRSGLVAYVSIPTYIVQSGGSRDTWGMVTAGVIVGLLLSAVLVSFVLNASSLSTKMRRQIRLDVDSAFHLHYQPIVDVHTGQWVGAEALMRWTLKNGREISPSIFIRTAEKIGLINSVTNKLMMLFETDAASLLRIYPELHIALNISPLDFNHDQFPERIDDLLERMQIPASSLHLEITESAMLTGEHVVKNMKAMRERDVKVAIDDFGTGYSGLSYLTNFGAHILKIDKSFVDTIAIDSAPSHVVDHIISMAKSLDMQLVAEGVETAYQIEYLRARGVQYAQGWHFSKALPFAEFEQQFKRGRLAMRR